MLVAYNGQELFGRKSSGLPERQALPEVAHARSGESHLRDRLLLRE